MERFLESLPEEDLKCIVASFPSIVGGEVSNAFPDSSKIEGVIRYSKYEVYEKYNSKL